MASATEPRPPAPNAPPVQPAEDKFVNAQIQRTRRALKMVDLTAGIITLVIGILAYVLVLTLLEHWVIPGGWSDGTRVVLFSGLLLGIAWYSWRAFWPLLSQPINPAYAAQTIEQNSPSLKNSLLNLLLLRTRKRQLSRQVYQAIEQQAAQRLSETPLESVVDRSAILHLGYVLLAVFAACALYSLFSPKALMDSATRVLLPWADVSVPSRVQISNLQPGDTSAARGDQITISAEILGLAEEEQVRLLYSTADQQVVKQEIFMSPQEGGLQFECRLPGGVAVGDSGLQQNLTYWIEAGDARSPRYQVTVFSRPTLVVQKIHYDYPNYTGYPDREEAHTGDLNAIEGTVVTLTAIANQPISSAHVDFQADGKVENLMKADNLQATTSFPLQLRDDRRTPRYQSYVLRYTTKEGRKNELPPKYEIKVVPDYSPEVRLLIPEEETVDVAIDEQVAIEVEARDPDFAVRSVELLGEVEGTRVLKHSLLEKDHSGRFVKQYQLTPNKIGLKVGDILEYWAAAADNREPEANQSETPRRKIRIVGSNENNSEQGKNQSGDGDNEGQQDQQQAGQNGAEGEQESGENRDSGNSEQQKGQEGDHGEDGQGGVGQEGEGNEGENAQQQQGQGGKGQDAEGDQNAQQNSKGGAEGESTNDSDNENSPENNSDSNSGGNQPGQGNNNQEKVSPEGDEDSEAFDRIAKHFDEQQNESGKQGEQAEQQPGEGESAEDQQTQNDPGAADGKPDSDQSGETDSQDTPQGDTQGAEGQQQEQSSDAEGAKGEQAPEQEDADGEQQQQPGQENEEGESPDGKMSPEQGESGDGENPEQQQGSPEDQGGKKPEDRESEDSEGQKLDDQESPSEGKDQSESDTESSTSGDRTGEGQEGSGQQADDKGTGGAGENQAADEGGSQSQQPGEGETSSQPGDGKQSEDQTGHSSGDQPGQGSEQAENDSQGEKQGTSQGKPSDNQKQGTEGEEPTDELPEGEKPSDGGTEQDQQQPNPQDPSGEDSADPQGQQPPGGGTGNDSQPPPPGEIEPGDEANLEYAKKQTDLIIDKLDDQMKKKQVDDQLLDKLGWNQDELRRFVDRWKDLKTQAEGEGDTAEQAQQELNDALRSLGLNENRRTGFKAKTAKDLFRDLQDAPRVRTPLEYQDRLRGYIKGTAAGDSDEE